MKLINLTPHPIILIGDSMTAEIKPSGLARCKVTTEKVGEVNGFPVNKNTYSQVVGLPDPEKDTVYIVSAIVAKAVNGKREDCICNNLIKRGVKMILLIITNIIFIIIIIFQRAKFDRLMDEFLMAKTVAILKDKRLKALEQKERLIENDR